IKSGGVRTWNLKAGAGYCARKYPSTILSGWKQQTRPLQCERLLASRDENSPAGACPGGLFSCRPCSFFDGQKHLSYVRMEPVAGRMPDSCDPALTTVPCEDFLVAKGLILVILTRPYQQHEPLDRQGHQIVHSIRAD